MYQPGDLVVYGVHGVCKVADLEMRTLDRKKVTYLVLEPLGQDSSRYLVPTHNETAMGKLRGLLTPGELEALLSSDEVLPNEWISDDNTRKSRYRELITSGDRSGLMQMLRTLYKHRKTLLEAGKKVHQADENFLRDAEKLLVSEICVVMDLTPEQAKNYLHSHLMAE